MGQDGDSDILEKWIGSPAIAHRSLPVIYDYPMCKNIAGVSRPRRITEGVGRVADLVFEDVRYHIENDHIELPKAPKAL